MKINVRLVAGAEPEGRDLRHGPKLVLHSVNRARQLCDACETPLSVTSFSRKTQPVGLP